MWNVLHSKLALCSPLGHSVLDVANNSRVGVAVALPAGQVVLDQGCKGDGSLAWVTTSTCRGDLLIASVYGDRNRRKRIALWNWMVAYLPEGNWLLCGDFNNTEFIEDSVGPSSLLHGSERGVEPSPRKI